MTDFGLDITESTHQEGDKFSRKEDLTLAFGLKYHERSKKERQEYAATIEKDSDGNYSFVGVTSSSMFAKNPFNMTMEERTYFELSTYGENAVGHIHTHWNDDGSPNFSPYDYSGAVQQTQFMFLVNENGDIYYTEGSTKKGSINGFAPPKNKKFSL